MWEEEKRKKAIEERDIAVSERNEAILEKNKAFTERDVAKEERNKAFMERDKALTECDELSNFAKDLQKQCDSIVTDKAVFMESYLREIALQNGLNALEDCNIRYNKWKQENGNAGDGYTDDFENEWNED